MAIQGNTHYTQAGVNIEAGNALIEHIKPLAKSTSRKGADVALGGFGGLFDLAAVGYKDPVLVSATDGVGTKLKIAIETGIHNTVGIDLVAMCVNDLVVQGAEPLFFLDYFATGKLDVAEAKSVIEGIAEGCKQAGAALIGGETAEMPGMYKAGDYDLAGFAVGAVERQAILPQQVSEGDCIIGLASSGVHSNGFSLVRKLLDKQKVSFESMSIENEKNWGQLLLTPTKIYVSSCLAAIATGHVHALAHITGGGLTENIPRILPDELAVTIDCTSWQMPTLFQWIRKVGSIPVEEMLLTFNCGIGMILVVKQTQAENVLAVLRDKGEEARVIGSVSKRKQLAIEYQNMDALC